MSGRNVLTVVVCLLVSAVFAGCIVVADTNRRHTGMVPSAATIKQVELGETTAEWLIAAVGQPSSRQKVDEHTELLRYERTTTVNSSLNILVLLHTNDNTRTHEAVVFEVVDGVVQKYWTEPETVAAN